MYGPTLDPDIEIMYLEGGVEYRRISTGDKWRVWGTCNQCGLCVIGARPFDRYQWQAAPGTPYSVVDLWYGKRLDDPVTPGFNEDMIDMARATPTATVNGCSMTVEVV